MKLNHATAERVAQGLTILSFIALCWVAHRVMQPRTQCVNSSFLSFVQIGKERVPNCLLEHRLSFHSTNLSSEQLGWVRKLEVLEPLTRLMPERRPRLAVEVVAEDPRMFELGKNYVRVGKDWLTDDVQTRRALLMGILHTQFPETYTNQFQLEVMTDFLLLSVLGKDRWSDEETGESYSLTKDMKFSTAAASFEQYCSSPFRSLSHNALCAVNSSTEDDQANIWGLRPLLAVSLWRAYEKLSIRDQLKMMDAIKAGVGLPMVQSLSHISADGLVSWFRSSLGEHLHALTGRPHDAAVKRTLTELEVESPTKWELTMDVTNTPAWREIFEQMRRRAEFVKGERVLMFTPEGAIALPSGLPVAWAADEISSQKHVMIACQWPKPEEAVHIRARHMFAKQSCDKLTSPFWD